MKYTEKEFKEKAILMKPWILKIKEDFINTKQAFYPYVDKHNYL